MSNWYIASEENLEALQHYGVKGMKWGKRTEPIDKHRGGFSQSLDRGRVWGTTPLEREYLKSNGTKYRNLYSLDYQEAKDRANTIRDKRNNKVYNNGSEAGKKAGDYAIDRKIRIDAENRIEEARRKEREAKEKAAGGRKVSQEYLNEREYNSKTNNYFGQGSEKKTGGPTYMTTDKWGNTVRADSKEELDKINEQKKKDKKEEFKKKFKNLTDRIKNTAKGLGK